MEKGQELKPSLGSVLGQYGTLFTVFPSGPSSFQVGESVITVERDLHSVADLQGQLAKAREELEPGRMFLCVLESGTGRTGFTALPEGARILDIRPVDANPVRREYPATEVTLEHKFTLLRRKPKLGTVEPPLWFALPVTPANLAKVSLRDDNGTHGLSRHLQTDEVNKRVRVDTASLGKGRFTLTIKYKAKRTATRNDFVRYHITSMSSNELGWERLYQTADMVRKIYVDILRGGAVQGLNTQFTGTFKAVLGAMSRCTAGIAVIGCSPVPTPNPSYSNLHVVRITFEDKQVFDMEIHHSSLESL